MDQPAAKISQIGYVVGDMDQALEHWLVNKMAGPFFVIDKIPLDNPSYRGAATNPGITAALGVLRWQVY